MALETGTAAEPLRARATRSAATTATATASRAGRGASAHWTRASRCSERQLLRQVSPCRARGIRATGHVRERAPSAGFPGRETARLYDRSSIVGGTFARAKKVLRRRRTSRTPHRRTSRPALALSARGPEGRDSRNPSFGDAGGARPSYSAPCARAGAGFRRGVLFDIPGMKERPCFGDGQPEGASARAPRPGGGARPCGGGRWSGRSGSSSAPPPSSRAPRRWRRPRSCSAIWTKAPAQASLSASRPTPRALISPRRSDSRPAATSGATTSRR